MTIFRMCGDLPLALRVAAEFAVRQPWLRLQALAEQLADESRRLDVLDAGGDERTALRAVFSWSYRNLTPAAARMFRLIGLLGEQIDVEKAAEKAGVSVVEADLLLQMLARAHLLQLVGVDRYDMHELLRAYAATLPAEEPLGVLTIRGRAYKCSRGAAGRPLDGRGGAQTTVDERAQKYLSRPG
jgi:hypothetical protein